MNLRALCFALLSPLGCLQLLHAGGIPWTDDSYYHFAQNQTLDSLIRDFTAIQSVDVVISPQLSGTVNGIFESIPPAEFWSNLCKAYNLIWFYDGTALYVYPASQVNSQVIAMSQQEGTALRSIIGELDFASSNTSLRYLPATHMMVVSGPPRFIEVVQSFLDKIQINTIQNLADETVVQVFPLKYAFAYDVSLNVGADGSSMTIEGIATLLQRILSGINTIPQTSQESVGVHPGSGARSLRGVSQPRMEPQESAATAPTRASRAAGKDAAPRGGGADGMLPLKADSADGNPQTSHVTSITYDARLNAVIIRDQKDLMPFYQSLIDRFDVPTKAVEIQVAIVDVDVGHSREMGLDVAQALNGAKGHSITWRPTAGDAGVDEDTEINFSAMFTNIFKGYDIAGRVRALENANAAKTLSRPSVLTLDNIAAVISNSSETYIPVAGNQSAELFSVAASTSLRVIPHIIENDTADGKTERQLKLFVSIEDGTMGNDGSMPMVSSSQINTQTVLREGQSLVVGGYYREGHTRSKTGLPFFKNVPILGRFFAMTDKKATTYERLFIISPRIIEISAEDGDAYAQFFRESNLTGQPTLDINKFAVKQPRHDYDYKTTRLRPHP